jgi:hypothetical protein
VKQTKKFLLGLNPSPTNRASVVEDTAAGVVVVEVSDVAVRRVTIASLVVAVDMVGDQAVTAVAVPTTVVMAAATLVAGPIVAGGKHRAPSTMHSP